MELDEEDYELLGYVKPDVSKPQRYNAKLNTLGLILASGSWVRNTLGKEKKVSWRLRYPEKYKEINIRYRKTAKGKAATARRNKKYRLSGKGKNGQAERQKRHYRRIKANPVKYAAYKAKKAKQKKDRRGANKTTTNKNSIKPLK